ncbi:MAG: hypothetical protein KJ072_26610, partial [Verrucomicrobia bacterium]|nr:hypothetical protein [Verrucomicrobiota bacterium]
MNVPPDLDFWKQFVGLLFAQITVVTLSAWAITRWLRHGRARQWCWRAVFVLSGCWLIASALGVERLIRTAEAAPVSERQLVIRNNLPVENALVEPRQIGSVAEELSAVSTEAVAHAAAGPVWWPAIVWVGVGMLFALRAAFGQLLIAWYSRRLDRGISPELLSLVERAAERLEVGDRVSVRVIPDLISPVTHGW